MVSELDFPIANRALQKLGASRIAAGELTNPDDTLISKNASEIKACYDMVRRAELRRNVWRFAIRNVAVRPVSLTSKLVTFGTYASGTTYAQNDIVIASDGLIYSSLLAGNLGHDPLTSPLYWTLYFGSDLAQEYVTIFNAAVTYAAGDHTVGNDSLVYISLANGNLNHNPVGDAGVHWVQTTDGVAADATTYYAGEIVYIGNKVYISLRGNNQDDPPSAKWLVMSTAAPLALVNFMYPIGSGPADDLTSKQVYRVPTGFLRLAVQDPKRGLTTFLGAPTGALFRDWDFQDRYFTTVDIGVIVLRFGADIADAAQFDAMFAEGLACRLGLELCEPLTQSVSKLQAIGNEYKIFMGEARRVNAIEKGPVAQPEDDYVTTRN